MSSFSVGSVTISYPYGIKKFEDMDEWRTDDNQIISKTFWLQKIFQGLMQEWKRGRSTLGSRTWFLFWVLSTHANCWKSL